MNELKDKRRKPGTRKARKDETAEAVAEAQELAQVLQFSDFANRPRGLKKPAPEVELPVLDEAMRNLHAAANAALKLIFLARHRLGLPQL